MKKIKKITSMLMLLLTCLNPFINLFALTNKSQIVEDGGSKEVKSDGIKISKGQDDRHTHGNCDQQAEQEGIGREQHRNGVSAEPSAQRARLLGLSFHDVFSLLSASICTRRA